MLKNKNSLSDLLLKRGEIYFLKGIVKFLIEKN